MNASHHLSPLATTANQIDWLDVSQRRHQYHHIASSHCSIAMLHCLSFRGTTSCGNRTSRATNTESNANTTMLSIASHIVVVSANSPSSVLLLLLLSVLLSLSLSSLSSSPPSSPCSAVSSVGIAGGGAPARNAVYELRMADTMIGVVISVSRQQIVCSAS
jgi:hypothetical protein